MRLQKYLYVFAAVFTLVGCDPEISGSFGEDPDAGSADFSTFVALGDSLTAGFADSALYRDGQLSSYPAILAQQFALAGGGAFTQPLMPVGATGSLMFGAANLGLTDRWVLAPTGNPERPFTPVPTTPGIATDIATPLIGPFNNMGVPGAKSYHAGAPGYGFSDLGTIVAGGANPYFARFASAPSNASTMVGDAAAQLPSFFVLWIGNNDVLSYATSGGVGVVGVGAPPYGPNDITDPAAFPGIYTGILGALNTPGNKGVLVNIPDVTTIPAFNTVPYNAIPLDAASAAGAQAFADATYNAQIAASMLPIAEKTRRTLTFVEGLNPIVITDDDDLTDLTPAIPSVRQATANDYIILSASAKLGTEQVMGNPTTVWGVGSALLDGDVLSEFEVGAIEAARSVYNMAIKTAADADPTLLHFDAAALLVELNTNGIFYGSGGITSSYGLGGGFSADGVHPTARGYAVLANEMIKVINDGFGAFIPPVDPNQYTTVFYQ